MTLPTRTEEKVEKNGKITEKTIGKLDIHELNRRKEKCEDNGKVNWKTILKRSKMKKREKKRRITEKRH